MKKESLNTSNFSSSVPVQAQTTHLFNLSSVLAASIFRAIVPSNCFSSKIVLFHLAGLTLFIMLCKKISSCSPVMFVEVCHKHSMIICGMGSSFVMYSMDGQSINPGIVDLFGSHSISGCTVYDEEGEVLVFGWKYLAAVSLSKDPPYGEVVFRSNILRDLILDCRKIRCGKKDNFLVGYAQNILEVIDSRSGDSLCAFRSPVVCVLFSLSFGQKSVQCGSEISVASGTAFGPIHLWTARVDIVGESDGVINFASCGAGRSLEGHTGVIFRLAWSRSGEHIASASDDRSVRVWNCGTGSCVFLGWGHSCRVWDVLFVGREEQLLVTSSEDATIKLWAWTEQQNVADARSGGAGGTGSVSVGLSSCCLSTMAGHSKHIWRLAVAFAEQAASEPARLDTDVTVERHSALSKIAQALASVIIVSAGNDGAIKSWSLAQHCVLSGDNISDLHGNILRSQRESPPRSHQGDDSTRAQLCRPQLPFYVHHPLPEWRQERCVRDETGLFRMHSDPEAVSPVHSGHNASGKGSRRAHGAAGVFVCPRGRFVLVALLDGCLWLVDLRVAVSAESETVGLGGDGWVPVTSCGRGAGVTSADTYWEAAEDTGGWRLVVGCTHPDETISLTALSVTGGGEGETAQVSVAGQDVWGSGGLGKGINVWLSRLQREKVPEGPLVVVVAGVRGECRVWTVSFQQLWGALQGGKGGPCQVAAMTSGRADIVTSALLLRQEAEGSDATVRLVLGDCRGNLSLGRVSLASSLGEGLEETEGREVATAPLQICVPKAHGSEVVSCLAAVGRAGTSFCSLGHDGNVTVFAVERDSLSGEDRVHVVSRMSCLPVNTPDQVFVVGEGSSLLSIYVGGFESSDYVVWDIQRKYQLLRIDAGGWRRPHHLSLVSGAGAILPSVGSDHSPELTFAYLAPLERGTVLKCVGTSSMKSSASSSDTNDSRRLALPLHLGACGHGKVAYCGVGLRSGGQNAADLLLAVGAEDGTVKVFRSTAMGRALEQPQLVQEVHMPSHSSVRAMAKSTSGREGKGIVVCAGGRLDWAVWRYDLSREPSSDADIYSSPLNGVLMPLHSSGVECAKRRKEKGKKGGKKKAPVNTGASLAMDAQDHRILAVATCHLNADDQIHEEVFLVALGDSRGVLQLQLVNVIECRRLEGSRHCVREDEVDEGGVRGVESRGMFPASQHPILCCSLLQLSRAGDSAKDSYNVVLAFVGDTTGKVGVWLIGSGISSIGGKAIDSESTLLDSYKSHDMGANCLSVMLHSHEEETGRARLSVCSGGDDQSIGISTFSVEITGHVALPEGSDGSLGVAVHVCRQVKVRGASGSAVKGIETFANRTDSSTAFGVTSVGYDQRLTRWDYSLAIDEGLPEDAQINKHVEGEEYDLSVVGTQESKLACPLVWVEANVVTVGDVNSIALMTGRGGSSPTASKGDKTHVAVIGEGFQIFSY